MDSKLTHVLESLLLHGRLVNQEIFRLEQSEQFIPTPHCFQLMERIREQSLCTLQSIRSIETHLMRQEYWQRQKNCPNQAGDFTTDNF